MNDFKFRVGQTVYSPFGLVKIISRWGKESRTYDVKYMKGKKTETWTFMEEELEPFSRGGVASNDDDAVEWIEVVKVDEDLIATFSVWVKIEIDGEIYTVEKTFKEFLVKENNGQ